METKQWSWIDKSDWGSGPWQDEPDKVQWTDPVTGLPCIARRNEGFGNWCGYVGVPPEHPDFEQEYDDLDVSVHGGLTYAAMCDGDEERGICHVPGPGEPEAWWFGFDCAHHMDIVPALEARSPNWKAFTAMSAAEYRTLGYVQSECSVLAFQLAARVGESSATSSQSERGAADETGTEEGTGRATT